MKEFYKQQEIPREEIERLKQIEYPNFVSETLLNEFDLERKRMLDVGSGPNIKLAEFVARKRGMYVPLDIRGDVLKEMKDGLANNETPFYGVRGDVKLLPFADNSFDIVHQRFVLMNVAPETRAKALGEILRVSKKDILLLEYNWRTLKSAESPKIIDRFRDLSFQMFAKFSTDPYMGEKFEQLFNEVDPHLNYSLQNLKREESADNMPELMLNLRGFYKGAKDFLKDEKLAEDFKKLIEELKKSPIKFAPPEIVAAVINKNYERTNL